MFQAPSEMVRFNYGSDRAKQLWKVQCDCLALCTLEKMTGKTVDEFFELLVA